MKVSLIYNNNSYLKIKTIFDHVNSFKKYSKHDITLIDLNDFKSIYKIDSEVVILHYTILHFIASSLLDFINRIQDNNKKKETDFFRNLLKTKKNSLFYNLTNFLINYNCIKIAFIQDEYYDTNLIKMFLELINVNTVFTNVPNEHISRIYNNLNTTRFVFNLTGYVPDYNFDRIPIKNRKCDVFYRGRELHYWYGHLGQDKMNIGKHMKEYCDKYKLISNIDWNGNNCIYGDEWFKVLGNSKVTLATESGTTVFDMDNSIVTEINKHLEETPNRGHQNGYSKVPKYSYEEICNLVNLKRNEVPNMGQVSPKMFESIMLGTVLVMYEGSYYPGFLIPNVHYIVLKKDYSNIKEVINKIKDDDFLQKMSDKAYDDIIKSGLYSYKKFIEMVDKEFENPYMYKPNHLDNTNLNFYPITKYLNKKFLLDSIRSISKLSLTYDAVIMLTSSNWFTEHFANRHHYATRFARELPVYFVQHHGFNMRNKGNKAKWGNDYDQVLNIMPNINLIKISNGTSEKALINFKKLMAKHNIKNPLLWIYDFNYKNIFDLYSNSFKVYHASENYFCDSNLLFIGKKLEKLKENFKTNLKYCNFIVSVNDSVNKTYIQKLNFDKDKTFISENGCDADFYLNLKNKLNIPQKEQKIVIYQGGINMRIDFILLKDLIDKLPNWTFYFCGAEDNKLKDWISLKNNKQVKYFGKLSITELGTKMMESTVGIIPFIQDKIIYQSLPLKSFEYVSCGLPVVTVPIKSLEDKNKRYTVFQFAKTADDFAKEIEKAYNTRYDKKLLELRSKASFDNSYDNNFKKVKNVLLHYHHTKLPKVVDSAREKKKKKKERKLKKKKI